MQKNAIFSNRQFIYHDYKIMIDERRQIDMCEQDKALKDTLTALQQGNDWRGIVGMFDCDSPEAIPEEARGCVAFAMGHLMDNYLAEGNDWLKRQARSGSSDQKTTQTVLEDKLTGYIQLHHALANIAAITPGNRQVQSALAYRNYLWATGKQTREIKSLQQEYDGEQEKKIAAGIRQICADAASEGLAIYEKLLAEKPEDIKSRYRYARMLQYKGNEYRKGATRNDFCKKDGYLLNAVHNFEKVIEVYQKLTKDEDKKFYRKEYERSRYQLIVIVCDKFLLSVAGESLPSCCIDKTIKLLSIYGSNLLPRYAVLKLIKSKMDDLDAILTENGIAANTPLTEEAIKMIAQLDLNINAYDLMYRKAKMFLVMGIAYCTNLIEGYGLSADRILEKRKYYFSKGLEYAQYVSDVKLEMRRSGKESGGFVHEMGLVGRLYYLLGDIDSLCKHHAMMEKNRWLMKTVQFAEVSYYLGAMYIYDKHNRDEETAQKYLKSIGEKSFYYKKAQRLLQEIEEGVV